MTATQWLDKLQSQPWFHDVQQQFGVRGIKAPLWEATLYVENAGLNPADAHLDHYADGSPAGYVYGLFQEKIPGIGSGHTPEELTTPAINARLAAEAMFKKLAAEGTLGADLPTQLRSIERAGWNGSLAQDAQRQGVLAWLTGDKDAVFTDGIGGVVTVTTGPDGKAQVATTPGQPPIGDVFKTGLWQNLQQLALLLTIGALALAFIAGGFAVLAGGGDAKAPAIIPV